MPRGSSLEHRSDLLLLEQYETADQAYVCTEDIQNEKHDFSRSKSHKSNLIAETFVSPHAKDNF